MGACLRVTTFNGLNLHWLRRSAGVPDRCALDAKYAEKLAGILQIDTEWLRSHLEASFASKRDGWLGMLQTHVFKSRNHLRRMKPQVCPLCIHLIGYCRASWEYSLVTSCEIHGTQLIDRCERCRFPLRWDRPGIDQCSCKWPFPRLDAHSKEAELAIARLVSARLEGQSIGTLIHSFGLPEFLNEMTLDGMFSVLHAFGDLKDRASGSWSGFATKGMSTDYWRRVNVRAFDRLKLHAAGSPPIDLAVSTPILVRLMRNGGTACDREVAMSLLQSIEPAAISAANAWEFLKQGDLFGWTNQTLK